MPAGTIDYRSEPGGRGPTAASALAYIGQVLAGGRGVQLEKRDLQYEAEMRRIAKKVAADNQRNALRRTYDHPTSQAMFQQ